MPRSGDHPVILGAMRTPIGKFGGALRPLSTIDLGAAAMRAAIACATIDAAAVTHSIMGCVVPAGLGQAPARQAGFQAGLGREVTADTLNSVCGSGMRAVSYASDLVRLGRHAVILAGGMDSMSNAPYYACGVRWGTRLGSGELVDGVVYDGLTDPVLQVHMARNGASVAAEAQCSRADQDAWALRSQRRAIAAIDRGALAEEIIAVTVPWGSNTGTTHVATDEAPRRDTSLEALARLVPVFDPHGTVTAGNAPGLNDGAAALVVASAEYARAHGLTPLAHILGYGTAAWDTPYLAYVPAMAATTALRTLGLAPGDLDLVEINEAFASVVLISMARLGIPADKVNVNGGAIALGHPLAASGARLVVTLIHELRRRGGGLGLAALCSGTAQGDAIIVRVER